MIKLPLNQTIERLVAIVNEGYYEELIEITKFDSNFRDTLLELEKQINQNRVDTYSEDLLALFQNFELDALIRTYTTLDGVIDGFSFGLNTPVPSLLDRLFNQNYINFDELASWLLQKKKNEYLLIFANNKTNPNYDS